MLLGLKTLNKSSIKNDIISGIIIALVSIPISMGYSQIAGLPPQYGLYGSVIPVLLFALFASSPQYIFGIDAAPAALVGGTLANLGIALGSEIALTIVPIISFFTGIWLLIFYLMSFGRLTRFVSKPVMGGFITGICCTIILMQIPKLFGGTAGSGELRELIPHIATQFKSSFNIISLILSIICITVIQLFRKLMPKIPASVIIMIASAVLQYTTGFCSNWSINTLPDVPKGLGAVYIPDFSLDYSYTGIISGFTIAVVIASETLLAEHTFAAKNNYVIDDNSELLAFSVCNVAAAFLGVCPVNGSVSRTSMNDQFGGKSQLTSLTAAAVMAVILFFCTGFISYLPVPVLTSIVVCALWSGTEFSLAKKLRKSNRKEYLIFLAVCAGVLVFGTIYGVVIGVMLSFVNVIIRDSDPPTAFLGVIPGRNHFYDISTYAKARPIKSVIIYRYSGNLFFANIKGFISDVENAVKPDTKYIIVDASGIGSIDSTAAGELGLLYGKLQKQGIKFFLTEHISKVNKEMRTYGLSFMIESGGVRKTITDALAAVGYNRPYPLCDNYEQENISDEKAILQEFEWAFGEDAPHYLELYTEKILLKASAIEPADKKANEKFAHLWDGISPISDHFLLDYLENRTEELSEKYDIDKEIINLVIVNHREAISAEKNSV